jgi:hypothetical protein
MGHKNRQKALKLLKAIKITCNYNELRTFNLQSNSTCSI